MFYGRLHHWVMRQNPPMWRRHRVLWAAASLGDAAESTHVAAAPCFMGGGIIPRLAFIIFKSRRCGVGGGRGGRLQDVLTLYDSARS